MAVLIMLKLGIITVLMMTLIMTITTTILMMLKIIDITI
jgi:hypothetical protein